MSVSDPEPGRALLTERAVRGGVEIREPRRSWCGFCYRRRPQVAVYSPGARTSLFESCYRCVRSRAIPLLEATYVPAGKAFAPPKPKLAPPRVLREGDREPRPPTIPQGRFVGAYEVPPHWVLTVAAWSAAAGLFVLALLLFG